MQKPKQQTAMKKTIYLMTSEELKPFEYENIGDIQSELDSRGIYISQSASVGAYASVGAIRQCGRQRQCQVIIH